MTTTRITILGRDFVLTLRADGVKDLVAVDGGEATSAEWAGKRARSSTSAAVTHTTCPRDLPSVAHAHSAVKWTTAMNAFLTTAS